MRADKEVHPHKGLIRTILLGSMMLLFASPVCSQTDAPTDEVAQEGLKFTQIYGIIEQNYVDQLDPDRAILDGGIRGMLSTLDPYSAFFNRDQFELLEQQARGKALGFGSILYVQTGKVVVLQTAEGSPSWRAGLGPGDEVVAVNGTRLDRLDFNSLIDLLQRSRSRRVHLGVIRPGKVVTQDFELNPAEVALPTVDKAFLFAPGIGYIHLTGFEEKTAQEVVDALTRLGNSSLRGLLLDLRDNPGGIVGAALGVASLFLRSDLLVLTVRARTVPEKGYRTFSAPSHFDLPLIVLVNGNTASAAEIVAAALEEHDRALIVGEPTFGKGVVETVMALSEKTGLALTTAQYFTSSGCSIQRPLPGTALAASNPSRDGIDTGRVGAAADPPRRDLPRSSTNPSPAFHTDNGRPVSAGGGITPDVVIPAHPLDAWVTFLNQRGAFTDFASDYLTLHGKVDKSFEPNPRVLADFKSFLTKQGIRVPEEYWSQDQPYLKLRIKTEIFNLSFGLAVGEEVEVKGDSQVQRAAALFRKIPVLLKAPATKPGTVHVRRVAR